MSSPCLLSWTGHPGKKVETEIDKEKGKEKSYSSHVVSFFSFLCDSHGLRTTNIKSTGNLDDM
jgi:hypothetical protein